VTMGNDRTPSDNAEIPANIAQQHDSRGTDNAEDLSEGFSLQKAAELIEDGEYAICLSLLDKQTEPKTDSRQSTLRLICQICLKAHDGQWWQVTLFHSVMPKSLVAALCTCILRAAENHWGDSVNSSGQPNTQFLLSSPWYCNLSRFLKTSKWGCSVLSNLCRCLIWSPAQMLRASKVQSESWPERCTQTSAACRVQMKPSSLSSKLQSMYQPVTQVRSSLPKKFVIANHAFSLHSQHADEMMGCHAKVCHCLLQMQQSSPMMVAIGGKSGTTLSGIRESARLRRWRSSTEKVIQSGGCSYRTFLCRQAALHLCMYDTHSQALQNHIPFMALIDRHRSA